MSCFRSTPHFVPNNAIQGQTYRIIDIFRQLKLFARDIDKLYYCFNNLRPDRNGFMSIQAMYKSYTIQPTPFLFGIFHLHDCGPTVNYYANFENWLLTMWNFLTLDEDAIIDFIFDVFDLRGKQVLYRDEIHYIFKILWGEKNFTHDKFIITNIDKMNFGANDEVTISNAIETINENPILMLPVYQAQDSLRQNIWSAGLWRRLARDRASNHKDTGIYEICDGFLDNSLILQFFEVIHGMVELPDRTLLKFHVMKKNDAEKKKQRSDRNKAATTASKISNRPRPNKVIEKQKSLKGKTSKAAAAAAAAASVSANKKQKNPGLTERVLSLFSSNVNRDVDEAAEEKEVSASSKIRAAKKVPVIPRVKSKDDLNKPPGRSSSADKITLDTPLNGGILRRRSSSKNSENGLGSPVVDRRKSKAQAETFAPV